MVLLIEINFLDYIFPSLQFIVSQIFSSVFNTSSNMLICTAFLVRVWMFLCCIRTELSFLFYTITYFIMTNFQKRFFQLPRIESHSGIFMYIVSKGVPATPFLRHSPLDSACPPHFRIFASPSFFSVPPRFKVFQIVPPTLTQPHPALIQPTNLPWFKQIPKS